MVTLVLIGLVGGLITGISPCVLPMLPVLFFTGGAGGAGGAAAADAPRPGASRRPYLIVAGLVLSFSVFTLLGTLVVSALPVPKDIIRWAGLVVLVLLGIAMMFPRVEDLLERPFNRIPQRRVADEHGGFVLGLALGTVYVPCAGPVLAAITVAGASGRIGVGTVALTVAFAVGTAIPLLAFALAGRRVAERVRAFRNRQRGVRITAGVVVIALAVGLTFNVTDALQRAVPDYTSNLNAALDKSGASHKLAPAGPAALAKCAEAQMSSLGDCGKAPAITGIQQWFNTDGGAALTPASLQGKVVLVDFWAYSCINCQRAIKHVQAWYSDYAADGLVVIGVQTPEYTFESDPGDVAAGAKRLGITYPVALDSKYTTWNNFGNESWPADYLIDSTGEVRFASIGEGAYPNTESLIRKLLTAAHPAGVSLPPATDIPDATPTDPDQTPETYLGAERANSLAPGEAGTFKTGTQTFAYPADVPDDAFALTGSWTVAAQSLTAGPGAGIRLNFMASKVYLDVGGTGTMTATVDGKSTSYPVSGAPNIYTLVNVGDSERSTLTVTLSPGLSAYSFTFG
ncbi:alkyl hydroperoxide reductase/ Thiol specific antioxidant/ Mal allergen [Catenulispora acidiphila DSM 44928]|uniref:Alkyl hydroperoxide reductase/ Thiol specific antioxidant/ Mal allergen n=1 Tax=Catenulispora acidiphila (strain DSM 44928 / JCM 14897 / NBRC 102108 / NRRL B-24433 / ID139908) TaxID=479433 RepID=C7Q982_CATAD|nr:cytochrome c biogenesis protein CcdA [Catenulispora acidiphila]ACU72402.1 alkyl hydroperoxide reductase/ Thiol specific antioxidant/ Mal allergen [Catenulispora acidiphila DSM 44928]